MTTVRDVVDDNGTLRKHTQYDSFGRVGGPGGAQSAGILPKRSEVLE